MLEKHGKEIAAKGEEQDTSIGEIVQAAGWVVDETGSWSRQLDTMRMRQLLHVIYWIYRHKWASIMVQSFSQIESEKSCKYVILTICGIYN